MKKHETSPNPSVAEIKCNRLNEFSAAEESAALFAEVV